MTEFCVGFFIEYPYSYVSHLGKTLVGHAHWMYASVFIIAILFLMFFTEIRLH